MRAPNRQRRPPQAKRLWHRRPATWLAIAAVIVIDSILFVTGLKLNTRLLTIAVYDGIEGEALKPVARSFGRANDTQVQIFEFPYDELYAREMCAVEASCEFPDARFDVIMLDDPWLEGLLLGENPDSESATRFHRLDTPPPKDLADFYPSCLRVCQYPYSDDPKGISLNRYFAMPFVGNSQLFCYRADQLPKTWSEAASLVAKAKASYAMRLGPGNSIITDFFPISWEADKDSFAPVARTKLGPGTKDALSQIKTLGKTRSFGTKSMDDFDLAVYMAERKASMSIIWSAYAMAMANLGSAAAVKDLHFGAVPGAPVLGAWLLAAPSNGNNQDLATQFIAFATSKTQLGLAARDGNPPPRRSVLKSPAFRIQYGLSFEPQQESLESARPRPRRPDWNQVELRMGACLSDLSAGLITSDQALAGLNLAIATDGQRPITGASVYPSASCYRCHIATDGQRPITGAGAVCAVGGAGDSPKP